MREKVRRFVQALPSRDFHRRRRLHDAVPVLFNLPEVSSNGRMTEHLLAGDRNEKDGRTGRQDDRRHQLVRNSMGHFSNDIHGCRIDQHQIDSSPELDVRNEDVVRPVVEVDEHVVTARNLNGKG